ncbi:uncharacterized protein BXZ73DRAFT_95964 [Epithele typhae]|uniref:uncharacterized protein n=1 Tax=Epithele typhae TaxID=378194 RepID=UPI0020082ACA|nr:uncharacterized protein BXZ73DRAFT_95964 [Epithele typhae]KAH9944975.1 hypothetical protein BXZ73DRAFT_95964 [Epithele typhae]
MLTPAGFDPALTAAYRDFIVINYTTLAATVFMFYDFLITFGQEVTHFWLAPVSAATYLFFTIKYLAVVEKILTLSLWAPNMSNKRQFTLDILQFVPWGVFSAMRAHALARTWVLTALVFVLSLAPLGTNLYLFRFQQDGIVDPLYGCQQNFEISYPHSVTVKCV